MDDLHSLRLPSINTQVVSKRWQKFANLSKNAPWHICHEQLCLDRLLKECDFCRVQLVQQAQWSQHQLVTLIFGEVYQDIWKGFVRARKDVVGFFKKVGTPREDIFEPLPGQLHQTGKGTTKYMYHASIIFTHTQTDYRYYTYCTYWGCLGIFLLPCFGSRKSLRLEGGCIAQAGCTACWPVLWSNLRILLPLLSVVTTTSLLTTSTSPLNKRKSKIKRWKSVESSQGLSRLST